MDTQFKIYVAFDFQKKEDDAIVMRGALLTESIDDCFLMVISLNSLFIQLSHLFKLIFEHCIFK